MSWTGTLHSFPTELQQSFLAGWQSRIKAYDEDGNVVKCRETTSNGAIG
ncbi:MAG: hypothetical protein IPF97_08140 [Sphingomonadales bacterium]|nr:hypothetical protein [Sphingomonadales bacterium]